MNGEIVPVLAGFALGYALNAIPLGARTIVAVAASMVFGIAVTVASGELRVSPLLAVYDATLVGTCCAVAHVFGRGGVRFGVGCSRIGNWRRRFGCERSEPL